MTGLIAFGFALAVTSNLPLGSQTAAPEALVPAAAPSLPDVKIPSVVSDPPTVEVEPPRVVAVTAGSDPLLSRTYKWTYAGKEWTWDLKLPQSLFNYFNNLPRSPTPNYSVYVTHPLDDPYLGGLVARLQDSASTEGYSEFQTD